MYDGFVICLYFDIYAVFMSQPPNTAVHISIYPSQMTSSVPKHSYHAEAKWEYVIKPMLKLFYDRARVSALYTTPR